VDADLPGADRVTFSLFGFIIGIWATVSKTADDPDLVVTPLTFLGGSFYSVNMLPSGWPP